MNQEPVNRNAIREGDDNQEAYYQRNGWYPPYSEDDLKLNELDTAHDIVVKLWNVSSDDATMIVEKNTSWMSCVDGMQVIYPSLSFEEALVLIIHYKNPMYDKMKDYTMCESNMRDYIRSEIKKLCLLHTTCTFDEWYVLAKYKYLKK